MYVNINFCYFFLNLKFKRIIIFLNICFYGRLNLKLEPKVGTKSWNLMSKVALITGVSGQDGSYLAELLVGKGRGANYAAVYGMGRQRRPKNLNEFVWKHPNFHYYQGNLLDTSFMTKLLCTIKLTHCANVGTNVGTNVDQTAQLKCLEVYHLAAQTSVRRSEEMSELTLRTNTNATLRMLNAIRTLELDKVTRIFYPVEPSLKTKPTSICQISKQTTTDICKLYCRKYGMHIVIGHIHPHISERSNADLICNLREFVNGKVDYIFVEEPLDQIFSLLHASDVVKTIWASLQRDKGTTFFDDGCASSSDIEIGDKKSFFTVRELIETTLKVSKNITIKWTNCVGVDANKTTNAEIVYLDVPSECQDREPVKKVFLDTQPMLSLKDLIKEIFDC